MLANTNHAQITPIELVQRFRQLRVLVIGDAMLDTYMEGEAERLCSEGPVPVVRKTEEYRLPGGAANTAVNLRSLGAQVMFLSVTGRDIAGTMLRTVLHEHEMSDRWLLEDPSVSTLHKLRILANGQYVVRFDEGAIEQSPACQQRLLKHLEQTYARCDLVLISDYRYGAIPDALIERLHALHSKQPVPLLIDSKAPHRFQKLQATIFTPNYDEACHFTGTPKRDLNEDPVERYWHLRTLAQQVLAQLTSEHIAITLAEHGVFLLDHEGKATHLLAHPVEHAEDVGAGDSFAAAMALTLAAGGSCEEAARIAIDTAAIAVTRRRTAVVRHQELLQRVSLREYAQQAQGLNSPHKGERQNSLARLATLLETERMNGRRIVFTNGVFDILHAGHIQFLRAAKALGDVLVVGINSDRSTRHLKGGRRPINSERDRMSLVAALGVVDHVILFNEDTPAQLIRLLRPDIHVKGGDYAYAPLPEAEAVRDVGAHTVILPLAGSASTSSMIERIVALAATEGQQLSSEEIQGEK
jgi:D-beta-D-heptose 7-phosphate kinase/D-beta-D-heptose 1-phosphate adenosyltransferase